jgi:hypothetical protein
MGRVELYLYSLFGSSWPVLGFTLPLPLIFRDMPCIMDILTHVIHSMHCALEEKINLEGSNGSSGDLEKSTS